ncbi:MAG: hypothetical protein ACE5KH_04070 [Candidatus Geothermarchaeales archaeon]
MPGKEKRVVAIALDKAGRAGVTIADTVDEILEKIRRRGNVVTTKLTDEDLEVIETLVKLDIFESKSEATAFFIHEGIGARSDLVDKVQPLIDQIKTLKEEARDALKHPDVTEPEKS